MYNNIGLTTVRGTATSGFVQTNRSYVRPSSVIHRTQQNLNRPRVVRPKQKDLGANKEIQNHDRKRRLENRLLERREFLEEEGRLGVAEIDRIIDNDRLWQTKRWEEDAKKEKEWKEELEEKKRRQETASIDNNEKKNTIGITVDNGVSGTGLGSDETALVKVGRSTSAKQNPSRKIDSNRNDSFSNDHQSTANRRYTERNGRFPPNFGHGDRRDEHRRRNKRDTNSHVDLERKDLENTKMRQAFGIREEKHVVGEAFDQELQSKKRLERLAKVEEEEKARQKEIDRRHRAELKAEKKFEKETKRRNRKVISSESRHRGRSTSRGRRRNGDSSSSSNGSSTSRRSRSVSRSSYSSSYSSSSSYSTGSNSDSRNDGYTSSSSRSTRSSYSRPRDSLRSRNSSRSHRYRNGRGRSHSSSYSRSSSRSRHSLSSSERGDSSGRKGHRMASKPKDASKIVSKKRLGSNLTASNEKESKTNRHSMKRSTSRSCSSSMSKKGSRRNRRHSSSSS